MIPECLKIYLKNTKPGDRNNNLFTCMKHIKRLNPNYSLETIYQTALILNDELKEPLNKRETRAISKSIDKNDYKSSCYPFKHYCSPGIRCPLNKRSSKHLTSGGYVKMLYPAIKIRPWDIEDLTGIKNDIAERIRESREERGINPYIDVILKSKGVKIGDEALEDWYKNSSPKISESALNEWKYTMKDLRDKIVA